MVFHLNLEGVLIRTQRGFNMGEDVYCWQQCRRIVQKMRFLPYMLIHVPERLQRIDCSVLLAVVVSAAIVADLLPLPTLVGIKRLDHIKPSNVFELEFGHDVKMEYVKMEAN